MARRNPRIGTAAGTILLLALAAGASVCAQAPEQRAAVDAAAYPWSALARLNAAGQSCTAAVIGRRTVLTAAHCVYMRRTRQFLGADSLHVLVGYSRGAFRVHARVAAIARDPAFDPQAPVRAAAARDWAVLTLAEDLPADIPVLALTVVPAASGTAVMVAGYRQDRAHVLSADTACAITGTLAVVGGVPLLTHGCAVAPGVSGAPLLVLQGGVAEITAIHVATAQQPTGAIGLAVPVARVVPPP